ncbi:hypothetical protein SMICM17S_07547 [Streptomyces microflavus]
MIWYTALVLAVAVERLAELVVARRNTRWSLARGGTEAGSGHYPAMVVLHTALLAGCLAEVHLADRPSCPPSAGPRRPSSSPRNCSAGGASPRSAPGGTPA